MTDIAAALDLTFLRTQTLADAALERDVLRLFLEQGRQLVPRLADLVPAEQTATAHLLKGSCLGIGARAMAGLLERYGNAGPRERRALAGELRDGFRALTTAIEARLEAL